MTKRRGSADWVRADVEDRGASIAYEALLQIAEDRTAPAPARATAGVAILRCGGLLDAKKRAADADPNEIDSAELIGRLREFIRDGEVQIAEFEAAAAERQHDEPEDTDLDATDIFD